MAATYFEAKDDVVALVHSVRDEHHPELAEHDVRATVLFAIAPVDSETGEPTGAALKAGGYPALATIKICSPKERALGCQEVLLIIDSSHWSDAEQDERLALIDHEWAHIQVAKNAEGDVSRHDNNDPKLKIRKHDWQIGGFHDVVQRHGDSAIEFSQIAEVMQEGTPVQETGKQLSLW